MGLMSNLSGLNFNKVADNAINGRSITSSYLRNHASKALEITMIPVIAGVLVCTITGLFGKPHHMERGGQARQNQNRPRFNNKQQL